MKKKPTTKKNENPYRTGINVKGFSTADVFSTADYLREDKKNFTFLSLFNK